MPLCSCPCLLPELPCPNVVVNKVTSASIAVFSTTCPAVEPTRSELTGLHLVLPFSLTVGFSGAAPATGGGAAAFAVTDVGQFLNYENVNFL